MNLTTKKECEQAYTDLEISLAVLKRAIEGNEELINPVGIFNKALVTFARLIHEHFEIVKKYEMALEKLEESEWEYKGKVMTREMWNELFEIGVKKNVSKFALTISDGIRNGEIKK